MASNYHDNYGGEKIQKLMTKSKYKLLRKVESSPSHLSRNIYYPLLICKLLFNHKELPEFFELTATFPLHVINSMQIIHPALSAHLENSYPSWIS